MDSDALDETQPTLESADTDATQATAAAPADSDSQPMATAEASLPSQDDLDAPEPQELERRADQPDRPDRSWVLWAVLGIMVLLLIAAGSAYTGYRSAIQERVSFQAAQVSGDTKAQFELALEDIQPLIDESPRAVDTRGVLFIQVECDPANMSLTKAEKPAVLWN